jgi:hypothetical protein
VDKVEPNFDIEQVAFEAAFLVSKGWRYIGHHVWFHPHVEEPVGREAALLQQKQWDRSAEKAVRKVSQQMPAVKPPIPRSDPPASTPPRDGKNLIERIRSKNKR